MHKHKRQCEIERIQVMQLNRVQMCVILAERLYNNVMY